MLCCAVLCYHDLQGDVETLTSMLQYGRQILSQVVDENRRRWAAAADKTLGARTNYHDGLSLHHTMLLRSITCVLT